MIAVYCFVNYLLGSIPFGLIIGKIRGVDVRKTGSGNIGATNVYRSLGIRWGMLVAACDLLKGFLAAYLSIIVFSVGWLALFVASFSIMGHIFSFWLKGKGGKGVGTTVGVLFLFLGWKIMLFLFVVWIIFLRATKTMSLVNCVMAVFLPLLLWMRFRSFPTTIIGFGIMLLIWWAHRLNIVRLYEGKEKKLEF